MKNTFTEEQVKHLNEQQKSGKVHPYTCDRSSMNCQLRFNEGDGILLATIDGWVCPCGNYKQNWAHKSGAGGV